MQIALVKGSNGIEFLVLDQDDDFTFDIAESIIIGTAGNFTGRKPTSEEFQTAWTMMGE